MNVLGGIDLLKIKDLSNVIAMAQENNFDEHVFYNPINHSIELAFTYDRMDEDLVFEEKDGLIEVVVRPFGRDMFHAFFETIEHPKVRAMFFERFHGTGKYRRVKDLFPRYHLLEEFYEFKNQYEQRIAKQWCENHNISYIDENGKNVSVSSLKR